MDLGDLRKTVLDRQRKSGDEKQWLIDILTKELQEGGTKEESEGVGVKREKSAKVAGLKRKKEGDE